MALPQPTRAPWQATHAHVRASLAGSGLALAAVLMRRADLLVLAAPLVIVALWSVLTRPREEPLSTVSVSPAAIREGETASWRVGLEAVSGMEEAVVRLSSRPRLDPSPRSGVRAASLDGQPASLTIGVRSMRWGHRGVGPGVVGATSAWGAFRWGPHEIEARALTTLPLPSTFDATAPVPHPSGLVGLNRGGRPGDGSEFASIRPFQQGDRLRRIHWPVSMRTGSLHVTSTWADQDSHVVLVVDALNDLGPSEGLDGAASSLDVTVRAAGAMAEHYLHRGDRVGLRVLGSESATRLPAAAGRNHLLRVLDTLAAIDVATDVRDDPHQVLLCLSAGTLVIVLSPLVSPVALQHAVTLARRRLTVIVVDTLPSGLTDTNDEDPFAALAWRVRLLERRREMHRVQEVGVPVVTWRGPGSLDQVLRDVSRRSAAPRMARR